MLENGKLKTPAYRTSFRTKFLIKIFDFMNGKNISALTYWNAGLNGLSKG